MGDGWTIETEPVDLQALVERSPTKLLLRPVGPMLSEVVAEQAAQNGREEQARRLGQKQPLSR